MTRSTKIVSAMMAIAGLALAVSGIIKVFQGDEEGWQEALFGVAFAAVALSFRWIALKWYGFLDRWANKGK